MGVSNYRAPPMSERPDIKKMFLAATEHLSEEQFRVFHTIDMRQKGLIAAVAGAGSGKTRLLSYLVCLAMLRIKQGQNLFMLTSTRASKTAVLARVEKLIEELELGLCFPEANVRTFHSISLQHARSKHRRGVDIVGKTRITELLHELVEAEVNDPGASKSYKELCRNLSPEDAAIVLYNLRAEQLKSMLPVDGSVYGEIAAAALRKLGIAMAKDAETGKKLSDFDALICEYATDGQSPGEPGDVIFVDEAQDLTLTQSKVLQTALARGVTVVVLGDDSQGIYVFSGASFNTIVNLVKWTQTNGIGLQPFKLLKNHRSTNRIVAASELLLPVDDRDARVGVVGNGTPGVPVKVAIDGSAIVPEVLKLIKAGTSPGEIVLLRHKNWSNEDTIIAQLREKSIPLHVIGQNGTVSLSERVLAIVQVCIGVEDFYDEADDKLHVVQTFLRSIRGAHGCPVLVSKAIETVLERDGCDVDILFLKKQSQVVCEFEKLIKADKDAQDARPSKKKQKTEDPSRKIANLKASLKAAAVVIGGFRRNVERIEKSEAPRMIQSATTGTASIQGAWEPTHLTGSKLTAKLVWCLIRDVLSVRVVNASAVKNEIRDIVRAMAIDIVNDYGVDIAPAISRKLNELHDTTTEGRVIFSTIHRFKGSERPTCFVTDMKASFFRPDQCKLASLSCFHNDGCANIAGVGRCNCPRFIEKKAQQKQAVEAEAARLTYVAASRAKERLYMSSAYPTHPHPALMAMVEGELAEKWE